MFIRRGRRTFEMATDPHSYADHYEYQVPIFVLTQHPPFKHPKEASDLTFTFATTGLERALCDAKEAAGVRRSMPAHIKRRLAARLRHQARP
jgi:hypothetical protein